MAYDPKSFALELDKKKSGGSRVAQFIYNPLKPGLLKAPGFSHFYRFK
ncbi:hypothetical protein B481_2487 [Planococcus halocryophilus Or1]|nr:hypothetical protein B481_2487 [Planococcus halocryophilus Or1]